MALIIQGEGRTRQAQRQAARDFVDMLRRCSGLNLQLNPATGAVTEVGPANPPPAAKAEAAAAIRAILAPARRTLTIKVRRAARRGDPIIDHYCQRRVILDHIDAFPRTPPGRDPSATTRCEVLVHVLAEYAFAFGKGTVKCRKGFHQAHLAGLRAQKAYRDANGQRNAPPHRNDLIAGPPRRVVFRHCDGTRTIAVQDPRTGAVQVVHRRPRRRGRRRRRPSRVVAPRSSARFQTRLDDYGYAFAGTVESVEGAPGVWSDFGLAHQAVLYREVEWLKGDVSAAVARVHHLCVRDSFTARRRGRPGLDTALFAPGRRLVVFGDLRTDPDQKGGLRLEANEPDAFLELEPLTEAEAELEPDFSGELLFEPAPRLRLR